VYVPAVESIEPPDAFVASDHVYPKPDPPLPVNATLPLVGTTDDAGATASVGKAGGEQVGGDIEAGRVAIPVLLATKR